MKKTVNKVNVVYLVDAAGIKEGTEKLLPEILANALISKGIVSLKGEEATEEKPKSKAKKSK